MQALEQWQSFSKIILEVEVYFFEIIMMLGHSPRRRYRLKIFLFLAMVAILFSRVDSAYRFQ